MTEEEFYDLSEEEQDAAFKEAKSSLDEDTEDVEAEPEVEETADEEEASDDTEQSEDDNEGTEDSDIDGDEDEPTEEPQEDNSEVEQPKPQTTSFKANGQSFEFSDDEMKEAFPKIFGQAMDYTRKTQELAPWRQTISAMKDNGLTADDINTLIEVKKGDKNAIASLIKATGVEALDLDLEAEQNYIPKQYGKTEKELAVDEVIDRISGDREYEYTRSVVNTQWDAKSREAMFENPKIIEGLHLDIKEGKFDTINSTAVKLKLKDGGVKSDLDYYIDAIGVIDSEAQQVAKLQEQNIDAQKEVKSKSNKRKAAAVAPKGKAGNKGPIDYLDDNDEAFNEWYDKVMSQH
jgi:hypothetical protein